MNLMTCKLTARQDLSKSMAPPCGVVHGWHQLPVDRRFLFLPSSPMLSNIGELDEPRQYRGQVSQQQSLVPLHGMVGRGDKR